MTRGTNRAPILVEVAGVRSASLASAYIFILERAQKRHADTKGGVQRTSSIVKRDDDPHEREDAPR